MPEEGQHLKIIAELRLRARSTTVKKIWWPIDARNLGFIAMTSSTVRTYVLVFDWIAGSFQVNSPEHKRGFIFRAISVTRRGYTAILYINERSFTVNAFRVQVENGLEDVFFLHFSLVSIQFDISRYLWSTLVATQLFKSSIGGM